MKTDELTDIVDFGSRKIPYRLHLTDRKRLRIVVSPDLTVDMFAPESVNDKQVLAAVKKKASWIARKLENLNLVKVPVHCIEYVIMHELCHMKYHNHSKAFYSFLTRCQPDWRKRKETLDRFRIS